MPIDQGSCYPQRSCNVAPIYPDFLTSSARGVQPRLPRHMGPSYPFSHSTSTLRLPGLKARACSGLTLSGASLPRLQRRSLALSNGSNYTQTCRVHKRKGPLCELQEWTLLSLLFVRQRLSSAFGGHRFSTLLTHLLSGIPFHPKL